MDTGGITNTDYSYKTYPQPCPSCGHCPTCGRGGYFQPYYNPYPYYYQPSWTITAGGTQI